MPKKKVENDNMLCQREGKSENLELEITLSLCSIRFFQDRDVQLWSLSIVSTSSKGLIDQQNGIVGRCQR
jgi:hypothetical protein